jgi:UMP-CMP kinase
LVLANGAIVPGEITLGLIIQAIDSDKNGKFIIDGFPRNQENYEIFAEHVSSL